VHLTFFRFGKGVEQKKAKTGYYLDKMAKIFYSDLFANGSRLSFFDKHHRKKGVNMMDEPKTLPECIEEFERVLRDHRPIPFGGLIAAATICIPIAAFLFVLEVLPPYLALMPIPFATMVIFIFFILAFYFPRLIRHLVGQDSSVNFFKELAERNDRGRTVAFFFGENGKLLFQLSNTSPVFISGKISMSIPLGGPDRIVRINYGHCDLARRYGISIFRSAEGEKWAHRIDDKTLCLFPLIPRFDRRISREDIQRVGLLLNIMHDIDENRGCIDIYEHPEFIQVRAEE